MTEELHPALFDIVPSVVNVIYRRYKQFVERKDLTQECFAWCLTRADSLFEQLSEPNEQQLQVNEKRIAYQMRRVCERYCRREKAAKSGYLITDEAFYDTVRIAQLLPYVIASVVNDTALEQAQNLINDGTPRKPAAPAEGGNLLAILIDIKKAYQMLDKEEQEILRLRHHEDKTLQVIAEYLECAISTADRRCNSALRKLQQNIGGDSPYA